MTRHLDVKPRHREQITRLLREHLPGVEVWAYGSRVNGRSHEGSDLDLILRGPGLAKIGTTQLAEFNEAVQESTIPFLVEARDWARLPDSFQREIEREYVVLVEKEERGGAGETSWPDGWRLAPIEECMSAIIDYRGKTPRKTAFGVPLVTAKVVKNGHIDKPSEFIDPVEYDTWMRRGLPEPGDVVMTTEAPLGEIAQLDHTKVALAQRLVTLRGKPNVLDNRFLKFLMQSEFVQKQLTARATGTTVLGIKQSELRRVSLVVPSLPEQHTIAHILGTLDDKIELNRRMNETLEEMARALFKSWFIDFDPVHAKAALRRHAAAQITPPLRGSRQAKGDSPQARRWGEIRRLYSPQTLQKAQALRQNQTNAEGLLWHYLCNKQLGGYKFRRQQPIGPYIADFACLPEKLLIELDGGQHAEQTTSDARRDEFLQKKGYRVLRFWNHEVFENCFGVLESIYAALPHHPPLAHHPPLEGGSEDASLSGRGSPPPPPPAPAPDGLASATPPPGGSDWTVERAQAYLDGIDPSIAALFPDRFVDSELGEIPKGWEVGKLTDVAEHPRRGVQPNDINLETSYIALENMPKRCIALSEWSTAVGVGSNKYEFRRGEFLFGKLRPYFHKVGIAPVGGVCSTDIVVVAPNANFWSSFVLFCISSDEFVAYTDQTSTGTRMPRTSWKTMGQFEICLPTESLAALFQSIAQPMIDRIIANCHESRALAILRDTLLPKLVSGELRLRGREGG